MIRPEVRAMLHRWREVIAAGLAGAAGLWIASRGGYVLVPFGLAVAALAGGWAMIALRRIRFLHGIGAPGVVEVDEGQVGYFGPTFGGFVALADLAELRLAEFYGTRAWRLKTQDGQVLLIPVDAAGAERLYDAFAALPGIDMARVTAALDHGQPTLPLWRRGATPLPRA
ncbi:hypothetical protein [Albidovulum sp.]|uniref:hypothetical protein n=1 Tax=Albidovulum sp. TaxID=1872424 RepID=UPI0039B837FA